MLNVAADAARVRIATRRDEDALLDLCKHEHAENGTGAFSPDKALMMIRRAFDPHRNDPAIIGVVGHETIEGGICLVVDAPWNAEEPYIDCVWQHVFSGYRRSSHARDLIAFARRLSEPSPVGLGLPLRMRIVAGAKTEQQTRLYTREFGDPAAFIWSCAPKIEEV